MFLILYGDSGLVSNILFIDVQNDSDQAELEPSSWWSGQNRVPSSPQHPPTGAAGGHIGSQCCLSSSGSGVIHLTTTLSHEDPSKNGQSQTSWGEDGFPCLIQKALTVEMPHANPLAVVSGAELSCRLSRLGQHTESCWKLLSSHLGASV